MALSTARIHRVRGRPPLLAAGIISLIHSHSSSLRSLGYIFSLIYPFYTTHEDFSDRLLDFPMRPATPYVAGEHGTSRFSREVFPCMLRFSDRARFPYLSPYRCMVCGLPLTETASAPRTSMI